jgi:ATP-dependent Clp protease ATP-binding subunit ClpB
VRTTLASKPAELEQTEKELRTLEIERAALTREKNTPKVRLSELEERIVSLRKELDEKRSNWESEKKRLEQKELLKNRIEQKRQEALQGERLSDFNLVARIRYSEIPALEKELQVIEDTLVEARKNGTLSLYETVDSTDIARVISKWTGIPVGQLGTSEKERIRNLAENMKKRVIGQSDAIDTITAAIARSKTGISEPDRPIGSFLLL